MSFNLASSLLCVSSATETVHIFRLGVVPEPQIVSSGSAAVGGNGSGSTSSPLSSGGGISSISSAEDGLRTRRKTNESDDFSGSDSATTTDGNNGFTNFLESKRRSGTLAGLLRRQSQTIGKSVVGAVGNYFPNAVTEMWEPQRDFAFLRLPSAGTRSVVAMSNSSPQVMVVTSDGFFYLYNVDMEKGGECVLTKQYS